MANNPTPTTQIPTEQLEQRLYILGNAIELLSKRIADPTAYPADIARWNFQIQADINAQNSLRTQIEARAQEAATGASAGSEKASLTQADVNVLSGKKLEQ